MSTKYITLNGELDKYINNLVYFDTPISIEKFSNSDFDNETKYIIFINSETSEDNYLSRIKQYLKDKNSPLYYKKIKDLNNIHIVIFFTDKMNATDIYSEETNNPVGIAKDLLDKYGLKNELLNFIMVTYIPEKFKNLEQQKFKYVYVPFFSHLPDDKIVDLSRQIYFDYILPQNNPDTTFLLRKNYYISYNFIGKSHRSLLYYFLFKENFLKKGIFSYRYGAGDCQFELLPIEEKIQRFITDVEFGFERNFCKDVELHKGNNLLQEIVKKIPYKSDMNDEELLKNSGSVLLNVIDHFSSYFNIMTITDWNCDQIHLDEKCWKPILTFQPFIAIGPAYSLEGYHSLGFKTFHPYIDESYDRIEDQGERFLAIMNNINKLCNMSKSQINDWYFKMTDIYEYNNKLLYEIYYFQSQKKIKKFLELL
jgi:hypothetical protein